MEVKIHFYITVEMFSNFLNTYWTYIIILFQAIILWWISFCFSFLLLVFPGLSKKFEKLSRNKDCQVLRKWLLDIKHHIYWSAMSSTEGPEKVAKWKSLFIHIQNVHTHDDPVLPKCAHADRVSRDPSKWLKPGLWLLFLVFKTNNLLLVWMSVFLTFPRCLL